MVKKDDQLVQPLISPAQSLPELTFKAIIIAIVLTIILAAANAYLALKIGATISASIPASVLAIGILRFFKKHNVLESNIVQTAASAGEGSAAAVAFVLPALVIIGVWQNGFPYLLTTTITMLGGLLGVLFSVPLRRILLNLPALRFPEGTAIGNVLRVSVDRGQRLAHLLLGAVVGGLVAFMQIGLKIIADSIAVWTFWGRSLFGFNFGFSPASLAAGYIIGFEVGISLLVGMVSGWLILLPILAIWQGMPEADSAYAAAMLLWSKYLRFVGVGTMLLGGLWTLLKLMKPLLAGLKASWLSLHGKELTHVGGGLRTERDIPLRWLLIGVSVITVLLFFVIDYQFQAAEYAYGNWFLLFVAIITILFILLIGFLLSAICGYFVGLVGSTNNPISGILIIGILLLSIIYLLLFRTNNLIVISKIAATILLVATVMGGIAAIANENIQDLKAGQIVGATPWKQQVMLGVGVIVATLVMAPIFNLLHHAYGLGSVILPAPQANLMAAVTRGVLTRNLPWHMIVLGIIFAAGIIVIDELLQRRGRRLPSLAVGLAIYLPPEVLSPIIIGSFVNWLVKHKNQRRNEFAAKQEKLQCGILISCGMVAGSALMGVILAVPFVLLGSANALAILSPQWHWLAGLLAVPVLVLLCGWLYRSSIIK